MCLLQLSYFWVLTVLATCSTVLQAAPCGSGSQQVDPETIEPDLIAGLQVSYSYSYQTFRSLTSSSQESTGRVIDSFCDLLSYYEMLNMITTETFENATAINQTTEGHTMTVNVLTDLQVLLRQNLMDMCSWIAVQSDNSDASYRTLFADNSDVCSLNETTALHEACIHHRLHVTTKMALLTALDATGTVEGLNRCEWIRQLDTSEKTWILEHQHCS